MQLPSLRRPDARWFGGLGVGLIAGVLAVGAVSAASPSPSSPLATTTVPSVGTAAAGHGLGIRLKVLREAVGRNFRVAVDATSADGTKHLLYVRGSLDVSAGSVTVTLPDNSTQTFAVDSTTVVRDQGKTVPFSSLTDGKRALVFGSRNDDGTYTGKLIRIVKAPKPATP